MRERARSSHAPYQLHHSRHVQIGVVGLRVPPELLRHVRALERVQVVRCMGGAGARKRTTRPPPLILIATCGSSRAYVPRLQCLQANGRTVFADRSAETFRSKADGKGVVDDALGRRRCCRRRHFWRSILPRRATCLQTTGSQATLGSSNRGRGRAMAMARGPRDHVTDAASESLRRAFSPGGDHADVATPRLLPTGLAGR